MSSISALATHLSVTQTVTCPADKTLISGGVETTVGTGAYAITDSFPNDANGWTAAADRTNANLSNWSLKVYAICAVVAP